MLAIDPHEAKLKRIQEEVNQLKREVEIKRSKISVCARELVEFCESEHKVDPLMNRTLLANNPFKVRGGKCRIS